MDKKKYSKNDVVKTLFSFERMGEDSKTLSSMMIFVEELTGLGDDELMDLTLSMEGY